MLKAALHQLNSEPIVVLKKIERCMKNKLPDSKANVERDAMQRYHIVKKSPNPTDHSSTSLNLKINLTGGVPTCLKRKASLEDAFTEADAVYETPKKLKRDESVESGIQKKKLKNRQADVEAVLDQKAKISETDDKEKGKLMKKLEKEKLKSPKHCQNSETDAFTKPCHYSETVNSGLPSSELEKKHSGKLGKKHEKKKKKSKEKSKETSRCSSKNSMSGSKEQSDEFANGNGEPDPSISPHSYKVEEVSIHSPKPTSSNEAVTDDEVLEESENQTAILVQEESNCDVPRSDSAATVALDIEIDGQSVDSSTDYRERVEYVNLVSPEKTNRPAEKSSLPSDAEDNMELELERHPEVDPSDEIDKRDRFEDDKQIEAEVRSTSAVTEIGEESTTTLQIPDNDSGCLQIDEVEESERVEVGTQALNEMDGIENLSDTQPLEGLEKDVEPLSLLDAHQEEKAVSLAKATGSPSLASLKTGSVVPVPVVRDNLDEKPETKTLPLASKLCCMSIDTPIEQLDKREWDIRQEQMQIRTALSEIFAERRTLNKDLRLLLSKSEKLERELSVKNFDVSANMLSVKKLSDTVDVAREERNRLAADKKKTHHMVLQTEIKLRELQVQVIRQQLEMGDSKVVESNSEVDDTSENEKRVADLTEEVASKSSVYKEADTAYQKAEQVFRQKNEEHETLLKNLEETRTMCQKLNEDLSQVTSEIEKTKSTLEVLADEGKKKCLRAVDIEEESIRIESCKKLKQSELKRKQIAAIEDAMTFEKMVPNLYGLLAVEIRESEAESEIITPQLLENSASGAIDSPNQKPSVSRPQGQHLPTIPPVTAAGSASPTEETGTLVSEIVATSTELSSQFEMGDEQVSLQTLPICLTKQSTSIGDMSPTLSRTTTPALGSPSVTQPVPPNNLLAIRMANSMINPEAVQSSTSHTLTTASFAVLPEAISLKSLVEAYPFYSQFLNSNSPTANSDDETILGQEIVNGCRQFTHWKCNYAASNDLTSLSRDHPLLQQGAGYMKEYFIPFYRLMLRKNILANSLFDLIILQAQKANWYGKSAVDSTYMKQMLENNLRCAIEIGTKFKEQASILPSRVEFSPSSGKLSMPTFTIHLATPEGFRSQTSANQIQIPAQNSTERTVERSQANRVMQGDHSPIGALSTMMNNHVRHHTSPTFAHNSPNGLMTEGHPSMPRQGWTGNSENNGLTAYSSTPVQSAAVAIPTVNAHYTGRHRMPAVQQTVPPPNSTWSQQQSTHQAYVQTLQSTRMQVPANYQAGPYRQQQATLQHQYTSHSSLQQLGQSQQLQQQLGQSQQLQQRLLGSIAGDTLSRQNMTLMGSHPQAQIPVQQQQRMRQQSTSQQAAGQQSGSHNIAGIQQVAPSPSHSLPNGHQTMQKQRQIPMSSPPAQSQRLFGGTISEVPRPPVSRRPSREVQRSPHPVYTCLKCGQEAQQKCSGCQVTYYCSRDCQVAHWEEHGKTCSKQV